MRYTAIFLGFGVSIIMFLAATKPSIEVNSAEKDKVLMQAILSGLGQMHYKPIDVDDEFSKRVFDLYIDQLDGLKLFFLQEDIDKLRKYENKIDDEVSMSSFEFFDEATSIVESRKLEVQELYKEILAEPFDFKKDEKINLNYEKRTYATTAAERKENWRKRMKYRVLSSYVSKYNKQEKAKENKEEDLEIKSNVELEKEAREKELKNNDDWFKRMAELDHRDHVSGYFNAITSAFDPHTNYLAPKKKDNFDIQMSGRLEGIGARLQRSDDEIKVVYIVPGSASWRQKELEVDDIIIKVAQGKDEAVDVSSMRLDDAVVLIRGKKGTEVRLTVKKVDGSTKIIPITRDIVVMDESYAKSAILDYEKNGKKIGFINLPKFYADFTKTGGRYCASDVRAEVEKLKKENVDGMILDLRNNGGGSLNDVVKMSGLFIDEGPIVQVKYKGKEPKLLKDNQVGAVYDGPLVIMVNQGSASASEIMAAAMQDYNRAVIVGSNTFGKGTVQRFLDLDKAVSSFDELKPLGSVKLTTQKFYRIDGNTTQLEGVAPDIILPDRYRYIETGEKEHDYPLGSDKIAKADYDMDNSVKNLSAIVSASKQRTAVNPIFQKIDAHAKEVKEERDNPFNSLNFEKFLQEEKETKVRADSYEEMFHDIDGLNISNLGADMEYIQQDSTRIARFDDWHKDLLSDVYLEETLNIMTDLINQ